jgi:hypothetical protein
MRNFLQTSLCLILLVVVTPTIAQQKTYKFENKTGEKAYDLHIEFKNGATKVENPNGDPTKMYPEGTFKEGEGNTSNKWHFAAGDSTNENYGVNNGASIILYFGYTGNSAPEVKRYKWTRDNNLNPSNGVIKSKENRRGWYKFTSVDLSDGDGLAEITVADESYTFNYPPGLTDTEMATSFADFITNEVEFLHVSSIDDNIVIVHSTYLSEDLDNFTCNIQQDSLMNTEFKYIPEVIPTVTEWGVIILLLLVVAIGMVFLYQRKSALAIAGVSESSSAKPKLFDGKLFTKVFAVVLLIGAAGLVAAYLYFGSITNADPFGVVVSSGIIAYMVHFWLLKKS